MLQQIQRLRQRIFDHIGVLRERQLRCDQEAKTIQRSLDAKAKRKQGMHVFSGVGMGASLTGVGILAAVSAPVVLITLVAGVPFAVSTYYWVGSSVITEQEGEDETFFRRIDELGALKLRLEDRIEELRDKLEQLRLLESRFLLPALPGGTRETALEARDTPALLESAKSK